MNTINREVLTKEQITSFNELAEAPITILQIGEGNFLRGFFDWMIHECRKQGLYNGSIAVTQPRPGGKPKIDALAVQDGLYTLVIRGLENDVKVERKEVISVFGNVFDPYSNWDTFLALAESPGLKLVVSNTTEAGLVYSPEALVEGQPIHSFPGKLTKLLYSRFLTFGGDPERGLIFLPCELLEHNGDILRECILRFSDDWGYPEEFKQWVVAHNRFLNSLVDRIVTGYPDKEQAESWFKDWGYNDPMLSTAEPYHLWAIEAEPELDELLPLRKAGLNVHWVQDLKPFQLRKVRILNGAHTLMAPLGLVLGLEHVREAMENAELGQLVRETIDTEIIPVLSMDRAELVSYASDVYGRFLNPFIRHRLSDIAMNSLSKFKVRLLPTLMHYIENNQPLPSGLVTGMAGLLRYYKVIQTDIGFEGSTLSGAPYTVRDDAVMLAAIAGVWREAEEQGLQLSDTIAKLLAQTNIWGVDLAAASPALTTLLQDKLVGME